MKPYTPTCAGCNRLKPFCTCGKPLHQYLCERCGGTGYQPQGCWNGKAYAAPAGICDDCKGTGKL